MIVYMHLFRYITPTRKPFISVAFYASEMEWKSLRLNFDQVLGIQMTYLTCDISRFEVTRRRAKTFLDGI